MLGSITLCRAAKQSLMSSLRNPLRFTRVQIAFGHLLDSSYNIRLVRSLCGTAAAEGSRNKQTWRSLSGKAAHSGNHRNWRTDLAASWQASRSTKLFLLSLPSYFKDSWKQPRESVLRELELIESCYLDAMWVVNVGFTTPNAREIAGMIQEFVQRANEQTESFDCASDDACLEGIQRLHRAEMLEYLTYEGAVQYLLSKQAETDFVAVQKAISAMRAQDARDRAKEDKELRALGLPSTDYLEVAAAGVGKAIVPHAGQIVEQLDSAASRTGFVVPPPFQGCSLAEAIREHIRGSRDSLPLAVRACVRLLGDVIVHARASRQGELLEVRRILPIVDSTDTPTPRGDTYQELLNACFEVDSVGLRGGTVMGYKGFGKSQLVQNVALGKQLAGWALQSEEVAGIRHHVGLYVADPSDIALGPLRLVPPWAYLAAGLDQMGLLRENGDIPSWAVPRSSEFRPMSISRWLLRNRIDCTLVIDEAQRTKELEESKRSGVENFTPRSREFWGAMDSSISNRDFAMTVLTGTGSDLASVVYDRFPKKPQFKFEVQRTQFKSRWMDFAYSLAEVCLMLLRQEHAAFPDREWASCTARDELASSRPLCAQDVVLALALAIRRVPASDSWATTGQVVRPSLESVAHSVLSTSVGGSMPGLSSVQPPAALLREGAPGRLTKGLAEDILSIREVHEVALASTEKVRHKTWLSGGLARSLADANGTGAVVQAKLVQWFQHMNRNTMGFRDVTIAMLSHLESHYPTWLADSIENPFQELPGVELPDLLDEMERLSGLREENGSSRDRKLMQLESRLDMWRIQQLVGYRSRTEGTFDTQGVALQRPQASFQGGAFAFLAQQYKALTKGVYVTRRELGALQTQTGFFGVDFELVVAESLHRGLMSKVLEKGLLPQVPKETCSGQQDPIVEHDRAGCFQHAAYIVPMDDTAFAGTHNDLIGRVLREYPDKSGGDLAVVLRAVSHATGSSKRERVQFHVIRIQVKGGISTVGTSKLKTFLSQQNCKDATKAYANALGVTPNEIKVHRLLASRAPLAPELLLRIKNAASANGANASADDWSEGEEGEEQAMYGEDDASMPDDENGASTQTKPKDLPDYTNIGLLYGDNFIDFLFPDAQIVLSRLQHVKVDDMRLIELQRAADPEGRRVDVDSVAQQDFWAQSRSRAATGKAQTAPQFQKTQQWQRNGWGLLGALEMFSGSKATEERCLQTGWTG